jgi:hypothetical protein
MLILMQPTPPFRTICHVIDYAGIRDIHAIATFTGITAQGLLGEFTLCCHLSFVICHSRVGLRRVGRLWSVVGRHLPLQRQPRLRLFDQVIDHCVEITVAGVVDAQLAIGARAVDEHILNRFEIGLGAKFVNFFRHKL